MGERRERTVSGTRGVGKELLDVFVFGLGGGGGTISAAGSDAEVI